VTPSRQAWRVRHAARSSGRTIVRAMIAMLVVTAALEVGGDAAIRYGLGRPASVWLTLGAAALVAYGVLVNANRAVEFNRLIVEGGFVIQTGAP
jgi:hypothetical protein